MRSMEVQGKTYYYMRDLAIKVGRKPSTPIYDSWTRRVGSEHTLKRQVRAADALFVYVRLISEEAVRTLYPDMESFSD